MLIVCCAPRLPTEGNRGIDIGIDIDRDKGCAIDIPIWFLSIQLATNFLAPSDFLLTRLTTAMLPLLTVCMYEGRFVLLEVV